MRTLSFILLLVSALCSAQDVKEYQKRLDAFNETWMPERIGIHTDRTSYFAGDRIWYSLYLTNTPWSPSSVSGIVYVELLDGIDSVMVRQKIRCREGLAHGDLLLSRKLPTGRYKLNAYTLWMKNDPANAMTVISLPVINLELPLSPSPKLKSSVASVLDATQSANGNIAVNASAPGTLVAYTNEEVLAVEKVTRGSEKDIRISQDAAIVNIGLLDEAGQVLDVKRITTDVAQDSLVLTLDRTEVRPRQKVSLTIEMFSKAGLPLDGHVSVSVASANVLTSVDENESQPSWINGTGTRDKSSFRKEIFAHPLATGSLNPFASSTPPVAAPLQIDSSQVLHIVEMGTNRNLMRSYGTERFFGREAGYNIPSNISYQPRDYMSLPTMEDFIRELVPQVRIKKFSGERRMVIRYTSENSLVYYFKEPALILIDGFMVTDPKTVYDLPMHEVERIDITWGTKEINSLGIFSLADNGVVSITTRARYFRQPDGELLKGLNEPLRFEQAAAESTEGNLPWLDDPVYWNPAVTVTGKTKVEFAASDRPGDLLIKVRGISANGQALDRSVKLKVVHPSR